MTSEAHAGVLAEAAAQMSSARTLAETLAVVVETAREALPAIDHVGVTLVGRDDDWSTSAATDDLVLELDRIQYELRQGPCVETLVDPATTKVELHDARHDARWHDYLPRALRLGLRSQLALQLRVADRTVGGLNMYSTTHDRLDEETLELAPLFATHASLAIGHARQVDNLYKALDSRQIIGQAVGLTMHRFGLSSDAAFRYLVRLSATTERKLRDVATDVIAQSESPDSDSDTR
ncbi:MAG: hypothetical protein JWN84_1141 [Nocardioides sp.]|jgi:GAF domain-containing protein|nr:hypothetical protein [Nocardioides sp.]